MSRVGTSGARERPDDFSLHSVELSARYLRVLAYLGIIGSLGVGLSDYLLYSDDPVTYRALAQVRLAGAGIHALVLLTLRIARNSPRIVVPVAAVSMIANAAVIGHSLWHVDGKFFYSSAYVLPLAVLPLAIPLPQRVVITSMTAFTYGAVYLYGVSHAPPDTVGNAAQMLGFATLLGVIFGEVHYRTLRDNHAQRILLDERARRLEELDTLKNDFFANVSHELRTPLTLVLGHLRGLAVDLREEPVPREVCDSRIEAAERSAARLLVLIEELLELSRLTSGRAEPRKRRVDLGRLVTDVASNFRPSDPSDGSLKVEVEDDVLVAADPRLLRTLLHNLLSNAHKFTELHSRRVEVRVRSEGDEVAIEVSDNGIGIPSEHLSRIFDRFYRVERGYARTRGGTGIGLALVREIAEAHGGRVSVQSELGQGSRFVVHLPIGDPDSAEERNSDLAIGADDTLADLHRTSTRPAPELPALPAESRKTRVVVAEDDPDLRRYIASVLSRDHHVIVASDGEDAVARVREVRPDVLVTDLMMPGRSGLDVTRELRADPELARLPVLFLTARVGVAARQESYGAGADDFLTKPFDEAELRARVGNLITVRRSERALADSNRVLEQRVSERTRDLRRLAEHLERTREDERRYLAREIHDETGQLLTALRLEIDLAQDVVQDPELADSLSRMASVLDQTLAAMRALVAELRPRVLDDLGLGAAVEWYMERFAARSRIGCQWRVEPPEMVADATTSTAVYRVLQESLTNVLRHSRADEVEVVLEQKGDCIELRVGDDGVGIDPERRIEGTGVLGMRERADALGGTLVIARRSPCGTLLTLSLPAGDPSEVSS